MAKARVGMGSVCKSTEKVSVDAERVEEQACVALTDGVGLCIGKVGDRAGVFHSQKAHGVVGMPSFPGRVVEGAKGCTKLVGFLEKIPEFC